MVWRRKESVSVGIASGQSHCECQGEKDIEEQKSIVAPINLLSSGFIYFATFPSTCSHTLFFPPFNLSAFQKSCIAQYYMLLLWKLKRGDDEASKLQNHLCLLAVRVTAVIYCWITARFTPVQWTSVCYHMFCHLCMPVLLPSLFTACEIIFFASQQNRWWK